MKIIRILPLAESWEVVMSDGSTYVVFRKEVLKMDMDTYDRLLKFLQKMTNTLETTDEELQAHGFQKRLL